jgi:hypothetical protein
MEKPPTCPDCGVAMDAGFVPDQFVVTTHSNWHPGSAKELKFPGGLKLDSNLMLAITAFRCPECGQLKQYATRTT